MTNQKCKHHGLTQANSFAVPTNGSKQIPPRVIKSQELKEKKACKWHITEADLQKGKWLFVVVQFFSVKKGIEQKLN